VPGWKSSARHRVEMSVRKTALCSCLSLGNAETPAPFARPSPPLLLPGVNRIPGLRVY
jgi:hypothetical protein